MEEAINYAIWLRDNTNASIYGAYTLISDDRLYYTDSGYDMESLYNIYLDSEYYLNSH